MIRVSTTVCTTIYLSSLQLVLLLAVVQIHVITRHILGVGRGDRVPEWGVQPLEVCVIERGVEARERLRCTARRWSVKSDQDVVSTW